jgi:hypothetical protein
VLGNLIVLFEGGVHATFASIVGGLDSTNAATALDRIGSSIAVKGLEPVSLLGDIGLLILGIGAVRIGLPVWLQRRSESARSSKAPGSRRPPKPSS